MLIFYLDEFGEGSMKRFRRQNRWVLDPAVSQWFILGAVGIAETSRKDLAEDIMDVKDRYLPTWRQSPWKDSEVKGRFLHNAVTKLASGRLPSHTGFRNLSLRSARALCTDLSRLLLKFRPIIYAVAVDKASLARKRVPLEPEGIAYSFLQQRLALLVDEVFGDAEGALMVADEQQSHERLFRSGRMLEIRTQITSGLPVQPNFDLVLDRPVWIDPNLHPLDREILQLPDIVCYAISELVSSGATPSGAGHLWAEIRTCFATHFHTGAIADGGISIYPRPSRYPPI